MINSRAFFLSVFLLFSGVSAYADMVEVKGNIMNGEIVSEDDKEMHFKDAQGNIHVFAKKDVTFSQVDKKDTGKSSGQMGKTLKENAVRALEAVKRAPAALKKKTDGITKTAVDAMSKPLDRSAVDAKSAAFAQALDEASQAAVATQKRVLAADTYNKRVQGKSFKDFGKKDRILDAN